jgi:RNA polymerase sigma-70 factor, ECF subfamily
VTVDTVVDATAHEQVEASDNLSRFESEAIPYMRQMFPAAVRLTRDRCDAEDLIQETFARAYLKFHQFTPGTNLRAWLHRIMFHTFYSTCRKRRTRPAETLTGDFQDAIESLSGSGIPTRSAEDEAIDNMAGSRVMRALGELPDCFKTVLYLADVQGYRYSEIAEIMGTPIGTVMSRIHRGRHMLRTKLLGQVGPQVAPASAEKDSAEAASAENDGAEAGTTEADEAGLARRDVVALAGGESAARAVPVPATEAAMGAPTGSAAVKIEEQLAA